MTVLVDSAHTYDGTRLDPGVYLSPGYGHAQLVGVNQRSVVVVDLGGVVQVAGVDVTDPDHLDAFADHIRGLAAAVRARRRPADLPARSAA